MKLLALLGFLALLCPAQTSSRPQVLRRVPPETKRDPKLESAIRHEFGSDGFSYTYNLVKLNGGVAPEALVYMPGADYCGSGGCTSLVFEMRAGEYHLISTITLTRSPVIVSSHRTNGWNDLIVFVAGGGIKQGYYSVLPFDGKSYAENPTVAPAAPLRASVSGVAYLSGADKPEAAIVVSQR